MIVRDKLLAKRAQGPRTPDRFGVENDWPSQKKSVANYIAQIANICRVANDALVTKTFG
jgi:hypothetical protein